LCASGVSPDQQLCKFSVFVVRLTNNHLKFPRHCWKKAFELIIEEAMALHPSRSLH
jgi:hypothetical protein